MFFYLLSWPLLGANAASFTVSAIGSYFMNKIWTFADRSRGRQAVRRGVIFLAVATGGLAIGSLIIWMAAMVMPPILAKLTAIGGTFAWNFTVSRRWVFKAET
jgi:putative flippase GtrA